MNYVNVCVKLINLIKEEEELSNVIIILQKR